jgi:tetratricopeptide (TPR) repeat protein
MEGEEVAGAAESVAETREDQQPEAVFEQPSSPPAAIEPAEGYSEVDQLAADQLAADQLAADQFAADQFAADELAVDEVAVNESVHDEFANPAAEPAMEGDDAVEPLAFTGYYQSPTGFEPGDSGFPSVPEPAEPEALEPESATEFAEAAPPAPMEATAPEAEESPRSRPDDELVDLGEWLREIEGPRTTRMVTDAGEIPPEGEQADFDEMLEKFKQGLAQNMDAEDYGSHYDLGVAFREMGLLDEAVAQFQKALRGRENRVATYEALGHCFVDKRQYEVAATVLQRALREPGFEDERGLGVLYLLGLANERMARAGEAARYYQRVFSVDINFRDIAERRKAVAQAGR